MSKNKRNRKGGYFVGLTKAKVKGMVDRLGQIEGQRRDKEDKHYVGGDYCADLIYIMLNERGGMTGAAILWDNELVSFARLEGGKLVKFADDHMDNISMLAGPPNPMQMYRVKAGKVGVNVVVVNYVLVEMN